MKVRILKPTSVVPYFVDVPTDIDGKTVIVKEQRGRSYGPAEPDGEDVAVEIDEALASDWIKAGVAEDFSKPRAKKGKEDAKGKVAKL